MAFARRYESVRPAPLFLKCHFLSFSTHFACADRTPRANKGQIKRRFEMLLWRQKNVTRFENIE